MVSAEIASIAFVDVERNTIGRKLGAPPDNDICIEGMRKYAERGEKQ